MIKHTYPSVGFSELIGECDSFCKRKQSDTICSIFPSDSDSWGNRHRQRAVRQSHSFRIIFQG
ncbi:hypothetical protein PO124_04010 [Bacillus licheniformis]|nr:hypothetical protein [Bacillus licheniformis]